MRFDRRINLTEGVTVEVQSFNSQLAKTLIERWPKVKAAGWEMLHRYSFPGLMQDAVNARAKAIYEQITAHEMSLSAYMPADQSLDCSKTIKVRGTGTPMDQLYYPARVIRRMDMQDGYLMQIEAKNSRPELEPVC